MKKTMRLFALLILFCIFASAVPVSASRRADVSSYLVVGFDDANANTDVMAVVTYDHVQKRVSVLQIPRDTYYCFGGVQNKLNQLYPYTLGSSQNQKDKKRAMRALTDAISDFLGIEIDGYIGVSIDAFARVIDRVGGISIILPQGISFRDSDSGEPIELSQGEHLLDGKTATQFVRYRIGYPRGDLDRIDAQKIFISALLHKFGECFGIRMLTTVFREFYQSMVTDITFTEALRCAIRFARHFGESEIHYLTLPGEAARIGGDSGVWYYSVNRDAAADALCKWVVRDASIKIEFDRSKRLRCKESPRLSEIYDRKSFGYRVYSDEELNGPDIQFKS